MAANRGGRTGLVLMVVAGALAVPAASQAQPVSPPAEGGVLHADAGEDAIGVVGHRVRLEGGPSGSGSSEPLGYRWVQVGGPEVRDWQEESNRLSFVPAEVGIYRFALVIAAGSVISTPDVVEVRVGTWMPPPGTGSVTAPPAATGTNLGIVQASATVLSPGSSPSAVPSLSAPPVADTARLALQSVAGGPDRGEPLAAAFDATAQRVALYGSYQELWSELGRRLEPIVPAEPAARDDWVRQVFGPLTESMVAELRPHGLDLASSAGQSSRLTEMQKAAIAETFRAMARGFRMGASSGLVAGTPATRP